MSKNKIVKQEDNFADWYSSVIFNSKLVLHSSIKGMMIFQPNGWAIWNNIKNILNDSFNQLNVSEVQLPLLIKLSDFNREKQHIEGFSPETFMVTKVGNKNLEEPYLLRPTSEILFCNYFKDILTSYKELPIKLNQWCNCFRAEKNTKPFLRTSEFFWQELHAIFASEKEARKFTADILEVYKNLVEKYLCIPVILGEKTENERFAGAVNTYTIESLMPDGQILQTGTSHYLGTNFANSFDIKYTSSSNKQEYVHQMSAGVSTRLIGAIIMTHSDNNGLVLPPDIAPTQVAILTINSLKEPKILELANSIKKELKKYRVSIDNTDKSFGFKISEQETLGTPISIVIGPNDIKNKTITVIDRLGGKEIKELTNFDFSKFIDQKNEEIKINLLAKAKKRLDSSIVEVNTLDELVKAINNKKIALAPWGGNAQDEIKLKQETGGITPRCIKTTIKGKKCFFTNKPAIHLVYFARAY